MNAVNLAVSLQSSSFERGVGKPSSELHLMLLVLEDVLSWSADGISSVGLM